MSTKESIAAVLIDYLQSAPDAQGVVDEETDLLESGRLDSIQVMDLVCFLESRFRVTMQPQDITPDNLRSVDRIARYVRARAA
ncbi:MAG: hypothetical protein DCC67_20940 [Planctomycetota bacterium]|nr:MAG: hypothetical protein DCC67_20940 [Planctomycetota bacterium]